MSERLRKYLADFDDLDKEKKAIYQSTYDQSGCGDIDEYVYESVYKSLDTNISDITAEKSLNNTNLASSIILVDNSLSHTMSCSPNSSYFELFSEIKMKDFYQSDNYKGKLLEYFVSIKESPPIIKTVQNMNNSFISTITVTLTDGRTLHKSSDISQSNKKQSEHRVCYLFIRDVITCQNKRARSGGGGDNDSNKSDVNKEKSKVNINLDTYTVSNTNFPISNGLSQTISFSPSSLYFEQTISCSPSSLYFDLFSEMKARDFSQSDNYKGKLLEYFVSIKEPPPVIKTVEIINNQFISTVIITLADGTKLHKSSDLSQPNKKLSEHRVCYLFIRDVITCQGGGDKMEYVNYNINLDAYIVSNAEIFPVDYNNTTSSSLSQTISCNPSSSYFRLFNDIKDRVFSHSDNYKGRLLEYFVSVREPPPIIKTVENVNNQFISTITITLTDGTTLHKSSDMSQPNKKQSEHRVCYLFIRDVITYDNKENTIERGDDKDECVNNYMNQDTYKVSNIDFAVDNNCVTTTLASLTQTISCSPGSSYFRLFNDMKDRDFSHSDNYKGKLLEYFVSIRESPPIIKTVESVNNRFISTITSILNDGTTLHKSSDISQPNKKQSEHRVCYLFIRDAITCHNITKRARSESNY